MKLLLFILALTCYHMVSAQVGGYTLVSPAEFHSNTEIKNLLVWGVQELTQQEVAADNLPQATYQYDTINTIYSQVVSGTNYRYDTTITNDQGWVLRATLVVYNDPSTNTTELSSYVYEVVTNPETSAAEEEMIFSEEETLPGGYSSVDVSQLDTDEELHNALDFGVQSITDQAVIDHKLPESEYDVLEVHSIAEQVVNGMNYRFDASLQNCAGLVVRTIFTVYSPAGGVGDMEATLDSMEITTIPKEGLIGGDCHNGEEEMALEEGLVNEEMGLGDWARLLEMN